MGDPMSEQDVRDQVRQRYAAAATAISDGPSSDALALVITSLRASSLALVDSHSAADANSDCCADGGFGSKPFDAEVHAEVPADTVARRLRCGNPTAVADLKAGERVLDLGSGGGIDVLLSARRVGETGFAYGVDMTDEMLTLARSNAAKAGVSNVEFVKGTIEDIPLPDAVVDVVISNCVVNLSTDKPAVLREMFRVLTPGGRIGISDVVAEDHLTGAERAERGSYVGCLAGALSRTEYLQGLSAAGFSDVEVVFTHQVAPGMHGAIVRATKPADGPVL